MSYTAQLPDTCITLQSLEVVERNKSTADGTLQLLEAGEASRLSSDTVQLLLNSSIDLLSPSSFHSLLSEPDDVIPVLSDTTPPDSTDISSQSITLQSSIDHIRSRRSPNGTKRIIFPTVLNANLRGAFCQKLDELQVTFNQFNIDIAFLTETWLKPRHHT